MTTTSLINWLLAAETPSIRVLTCRHLLGETADTTPIMQSGPVPALLANQTPTGQWANEHSYYTPKYVSSHWTLTLLEELRVDPADERFQRGVAWMLDTLSQSASLGSNPLSFQPSVAQRFDPTAVSPTSSQSSLSCFWGNILRYAAYAGLDPHPAVQRLATHAIGDIRQGHCPCEHNDGYACAWGVARTLWGLAALPPTSRPPGSDAAIAQGIDFLLKGTRLVKADYPTPDNGRVHPLWFRLNFPLFYQADILFVLRVLAELDALDQPGAQGALDWLEGRRQRNGRWRGSSPFRQRTWRELGDSQETNRWVSLHTAVVLQKAGRL